jgi:hypothetical protein
LERKEGEKAKKKKPKQYFQLQFQYKKPVLYFCYQDISHPSNKFPINVIIPQRHRKTPPSDMTPPTTHHPSHFVSLLLPIHPFHIQPAPSIIMALEQGQDTCLAHSLPTPTCHLPPTDSRPHGFVAYHMHFPAALICVSKSPRPTHARSKEGGGRDRDVRDERGEGRGLSHV